SRRFFLIPLRPPRPPLFPYTTLFRSPLAIVRNNGKILLHRWAAEGILAGLWELPGGEAKRGESSRNSLRRHLRGLHGALTDEIRIGEVRHSITNRKIRAPIFLFDTRAGADIRLNPSQWRWLALSSLRNYPVSSMTLKAAAILSSHARSSL